MRGECDDGRIVTLALARRGEGDGRQVASTRREGNARQVTGARGECEDAGKCKDGQIAGAGGGRGGGGGTGNRVVRASGDDGGSGEATGGGVRAMLGTPHGM